MTEQSWIEVLHKDEDGIVHTHRIAFDPSSQVVKVEPKQPGSTFGKSVNPNLHNVADLERIAELEAEVERLTELTNHVVEHNHVEMWCVTFQRPALDCIYPPEGVNPSSGHLGGAPPGVSPSPRPLYCCDVHFPHEPFSDEPLPRRGSRERDDG